MPYQMEFTGLTFPEVSDNSYDVYTEVDVGYVNLTTGEIAFSINCMQYWNGDMGYDNSTFWRLANDEMNDTFYNRYYQRIKEKLFELIEKEQYDEVESNPYPDW